MSGLAWASRVRDIAIRATITVIAGTLIAGCATFAHAGDKFWEGGTGPWENGFLWGPNGVPTAVDSAIIPSGAPLVSGNVGAATLTVAAGAGVNIPGTGNLVIAGLVTNDGQISIGGEPPGANFSVAFDALAGSGEVVLKSSGGVNGYARLNGPASAPAVTIGPSQTIRGEGVIGNFWINEGLIRAEETSGDSSASLTFGNGSMINNGVIRTSPTAAVILDGVNLSISGSGQFIADTVPAFIVSATINGGSITAVNGGTYEMPAFSTAILNGVTVAAPLNATSQSIQISSSAGGFVNNSTIKLDNQGVSSASAQVVLSAPGTISGTGELILNREGTNTVIGGTAMITNGPTHVIRGVGTISVQTFVNNGTVLAEPKIGSLLALNSTSTTNFNVLQANEGATLRISQFVQQDDANGRIRAVNGGVAQLMGGTIVGGRVQTEGAGVFEVGNIQSFMTNVTNEGTMNLRSGALLRVNGTTLTNDGVITVNSDGVGAATLRFDGNVVLQGTGQVVLNGVGAGSNLLATSVPDTYVVQSAGHTVRGNGRVIGVFINDGRMEGVSAAQPLNVQNALLGVGVLKDVRINSGSFHFAGLIGTTAVVPLEGSYVLGNNATLELDLAGATAGVGYDQLNSTGSIAIGGGFLRVILSGGFTPAVGQSFTLLSTTGSLTGSLTGAELPAVPGLAWIRSQTATSLSIRTTWSADFDEDGAVAAADLVRWKSNFGGTGKSHMQGDADGDGDADGADLLVWQQQLGNSGGATAVAASVPEPDLLWHAIIVCAVWLEAVSRPSLSLISPKGRGF